MSGFDDLEDDVQADDFNRPGHDHTALFDDDDDEEDYQPPQLGEEDDLDDDGAGFQDRPADPSTLLPSSRAVVDTGLPAPADMKAKLQALAEKKRQEAAEGQPRKSKDKDKGEGSKRKRDQLDKGRAQRTPAELKRRAALEEAGAVTYDPRAIKETEADRDFIENDLGSSEAGDDAPDSDLEREADQSGIAPLDEAEDATEMLFGRRRKKKGQESEADMQMRVSNMIAKMEAALEEDLNAHEAKKPATNKLVIAREVEEFLMNRKTHERFIAHGGLGVLKGWLEPYPDGVLPNPRVRAAVLKSCQVLPIDTARDDIRENLKKSQLGSRVMFYARCKEENRENQRLATELVQKWCRPIFYDPEREALKKEARDQELQRQRRERMDRERKVEQEAAERKAAQDKIKYGQPGYRWHASIPEPMKMDYVVAPQQHLSATSEAANTMMGQRKKDNESRILKKMRDVQRKQKRTGQAMKPSVEGRDIVLMDR